MLNYTSLFSDLERLFQSAGREPTTFRRLMREVQRVREDLDAYYGEVATDYVIRLEERLAQGGDGLQLAPQEVTLLRAFLGLPPQDAARDARLVDDLARLEAELQQALALKGRPLSLKNLDALRRQLDGMQSVLPGIVRALESRERARRFEEALAEDGQVRDRGWLLAQVRRALSGGEEALTSSEELHLGG
jgi:hypothetical protein